jgi:hypothetical protein
MDEAKPLPMDGRLVSEAWSLTHNWREVQEPAADNPLAKAWVPPGPKEVRKDQIDGVHRDPKAPDFLQPAKDSPLATNGAGQEDPALPCYIGAVPPEGAVPWDWDRTWRLPKDAQLLTVSKDPAHKAKYATLTAALKDVAQPWATVRVLDDATYEEALKLSDRERLAGLLLEASRGAMLALPKDANEVLRSNDIPDLTVRGFRLSGGKREASRLS